MNFRNAAFIVLACAAVLPWFFRARPAPAQSHPHSYAPRVTLRQVNARLDRIEAELMAIYRRVGGKEDEQFPVPPWLLKGRSN